MQLIKPPIHTDYRAHNGIWVPQDLQAGDIISCWMPTKRFGMDAPEIYRRNVLVLGFELDPETLEYSAIQVARFSQSRIFAREEKSFFITRQMEETGQVSGIVTPQLLATDRVDVVPLTTDWFRRTQIDRHGRIDVSLFSEIKQSLKQGFSLAIDSQSRFPALNSEKWYVPAIHLAGEGMESLHPNLKYSVLSLTDLAALYEYHSVIPPDKILEGSIVEEYFRMKTMEQLQIRGRFKQKFLGYSHSQKRSVPLIIGERKVGQSLENSQESLCDNLNPYDSHESAVPSSGFNFPQRLPFQSVAQELGGEAQPISNIQLPKQLWQGRYLMMRIADLRNESNDQNLRRPCVIWKAYVDKETGDLAGFELYPVKRSDAHQFIYKFPVAPLKTMSSQQSYLIADCLIRVPFEERYFHEKMTEGFFELPADKIEKFRAKLAHVAAANAPVTIYGLKEVPSHWEEVDLDPMPDATQIEKWRVKRAIRIDIWGGPVNPNKTQGKNKRATRNPRQPISLKASAKALG